MLERSGNGRVVHSSGEDHGVRGMPIGGEAGLVSTGSRHNKIQPISRWSWALDRGEGFESGGTVLVRAKSLESNAWHDALRRYKLDKANRKL